MTDVVIIGAGECGVRTAFALRESGYDGAITLVGAEPDLPYERPPLSKLCPPPMQPIADRRAYTDARIDLRLGRPAVGIDPRDKSVALEGGESLAYTRLVLATGARARTSETLVGALTVRSRADAEALCRRIGPDARLAIVGGGVLGLELAATARLRRASVTVIEAADRLMPRAVPAEIAAVIEARHRAAGVDLRLGRSVEAVADGAVVLSDGSRVPADTIVAAIGAVPDTALAQAAGVAVDNGIVVDDRFRTSVADIFAAGDACAFPYRGGRVRLESWRVARDQGDHLARILAGGSDAYGAVPWFWSDQYDLTLQVAGLWNDACPGIRRDIGPDAFVLFQVDSDGTLAAAAGIGPGNSIARDVRVAERLIGRRRPLDPAALGDPTVRLKTLL